MSGVRISHFPFRGGLDMVTPPLAAQPGSMLDCMNYECLPQGGYRRIDGYTLLDEVPGSGPVRGVHVYRGEVYAVRDDATNGRLYKWNGTSWASVTLPIGLNKGGTYRFENYNFYGQDDQEEMFMVNGKDKAIKIHGATAVAITTGTAPDRPTNVIGYQKHLVLTIESSLVISAVGNPTNYSAVAGASEIAVGQAIRQIEVAQNALIIGCESSTHVLYGQSADDWQLTPLNKSGTIAGTMEQIGGQVVSADATGVMSLQASQTYGNFGYSSISESVRELIDSMRETGGMVSTTNRRKGQYRLFSGRTGLYFTYSGNKMAGVSRVRFPISVICLTNGLASGEEVSYFGADDGCVYRLDDGFRFNEDPIESYFVLSYNHFGSPTQRKRYRLIQLNLETEGDPQIINVSASTDYGANSNNAALMLQRTGGNVWDFAEWDEFEFDSFYHQDGGVRVTASGTSMAVAVSADGAADGSHTVYGATIHYSPRGMRR